MSNSARFRLLTGLSLALVLAVRIRLLNVPLERDEGEHAYSAQLMLQGIAPWRYSYNMKLPGTDAVYAASLALFGQSVAAIHLGLLLANIATVLLTALLAKKLWGFRAGAGAAAACALLSLTPAVMPAAAHSTHFVMVFVLLGLLWLMRAFGRPSPAAFFGSGVIFGLAVLMKQPGAVFAAFGLCCIVRHAWREKIGWGRAAGRMLIFSAGVAIPFGLLALILWRAGVFDTFWFWTVTLAGEFASLIPWPLRLLYFRTNFRPILYQTLPLWVLAVTGFTLLAARRRIRSTGLFAASFFLFSMLAVSAGGAFEPHYFVLLLPSAALAVGAWLGTSRMPGGTAAAVLCLACLWPLAVNRRFLFESSPYEISRETYGLNPFPEAIELARYIDSHSAETARIGVLGSEAEIFFYARRRSASGFIFMYSLTDRTPYAERLQGQMIGEMEAARPEFLVFVNHRSSWSQNSAPVESLPLLSWAADCMRERYEVVGVADIYPKRTEYRWDDAARHYRPGSPLYVKLLRRKPS